MSNTYAKTTTVLTVKDIFFKKSFRDIPETPNPRDLAVRSQKEPSGITRFFFIPSRDEVPTRDALYSAIQVVGVKLPSEGNVEYTEGFYHLRNDAEDTFEKQPTRLFLRGFFIYGDKIEHYFFSRNGIVKSRPIEHTLNNNKSIMGSLRGMSDYQLGLNPFVHENANGSLKLDMGNGKVFDMDREPIYSPDEIVSERPICYRAVDAHGKEVVVKFALKLDVKEEVKILRRVTERNVWGVVRLIDSGFINTHQQSMCVVVITPFGRPLVEYQSITGLLEAFRDAVRAHRSLYFEAGILHRDVHPGNIIIPSPKSDATRSGDLPGKDVGQPRGVLIDLDCGQDLEIEVEEVDSRVGTLMYMAIDLHRDITEQWIRHTYRHDLESFFYSFLAIAICENGMPPPKGSRLERWVFTKSHDETAEAKWTDMEDFECFYELLQEFKPEFRCLIPLAFRLRHVLFFQDGDIKSFIVETKSGDEHAKNMYDNMIRCFDLAIKRQDELSRGMNTLTLEPQVKYKLWLDNHGPMNKRRI
ncbi:serine/threonine-protein kinase Sgk2 [Fusarium austroafricanum]|uniref:Serine/threonine-protein kinase Sgk2 n=1 Tax=Fusarium austroafricanum TaxID=2364996 RepID=A0A8H4NS23_9HYPO|nr:serine/threonine-protein kinase Sgk2 [Fusarium austroafricanum]